MTEVGEGITGTKYRKRRKWYDYELDVDRMELREGEMAREQALGEEDGAPKV
jgi:hypothetical protein